MKRICFVTCRSWPEISESDRLARRALEARGATVHARPWSDPGAEFGGFDAVVLRSSWDYHLDPDGFRAWLDRLERAGARVWNPPDLVGWNLSKRYLLALGVAGVPTVPTVILDGSDPALAAVMATGLARRRAEARDRGLRRRHPPRDRGDRRPRGGALASGAGRRPVLVQPFLEEMTSRGEWSLVFIDGAFTHAVSRGRRPASSGCGRIAAARATLAALPRPSLYARIDGVETREGFLIMEVEVNEPGLFFTHAPAAAERFALALLRSL